MKAREVKWGCKAKACGVCNQKHKHNLERVNDIYNIQFFIQSYYNF